MYYIRRNNKFLFLVTDLIALSLAYIFSFDFQSKSKDNLYFFIAMNVIGILVALMSDTGQSQKEDILKNLRQHLSMY